MRHARPGSVVLLFLGLLLAAGAHSARAAGSCDDLITPQQNLAGCDLRGAQISFAPALTGADLSGANLNGATISGVGALVVANLTGTNLNHATISAPLALIGATLTGANLNHATISGAGALLSADLNGANLSHASISGAGAFIGADLSNANLNGASISGTNALAEAVYHNTTCPDGSNSDQDGGSCRAGLLSAAALNPAASAGSPAAVPVGGGGGDVGGCTGGCTTLSVNRITVEYVFSYFNRVPFNNLFGRWSVRIVFFVTITDPVTDSGVYGIADTSGSGLIAESGSLATGGAV